MNDFDDLDDLLGELRSAATDTELAGATSHVDAMARHHRRQKGHTMITSRRARVAMFVAAGVIGFGGVAAAGPRGPFAPPRSAVTTTSEVTTTTSEAPTTTSEAPTTTSEVTTTTSKVIVDDDAMITRSMVEEITIDALLVDDPEPEDFDKMKCFGLNPEDFDNHGEFVSAVARNELELEEDIEQRDAAQSSCGKDDVDEVEAKDDEVEAKDDDDDDGDDDSDDDGDDDSDDRDDDDDDDDDDEDRPEKSDKSEKSQKPGNRGNGSKKNSGD